MKGACQGLGIKSLMQDLGYDLNIEMKTAAFGIAGRTGLGKTRHIQVNQLWVQERVRSGYIELIRIPGVELLQTLAPSTSTRRPRSGARTNWD